MKDNNKGWGRPCCLRAVLECGVLCFGKALDDYLWRIGIWTAFGDHHPQRMICRTFIGPGKMWFCNRMLKEYSCQKRMKKILDEKSMRTICSRPFSQTENGIFKGKGRNEICYWRPSKRWDKLLAATPSFPQGKRLFLRKKEGGLIVTCGSNAASLLC